MGTWALVGASALVTREVPDHALVVGQPARRVGWVCRCAKKLEFSEAAVRCSCGRCYDLRDSALTLRNG